MSYHDPDNLPFGVSPLDAPGMGISPWDSASVASEKYIADIARQGAEANAAFWREQDAALQSSTSIDATAASYGAGSYVAGKFAPGAFASLTKQFSAGKITVTKDLAAILYEKLQRLEHERLEASRGPKRAAVLSWVAAAVLFFMVLFNIQFFNSSYRQVTSEYFIVRAALLAALFFGWKFTRKVGMASTETEKSCRTLLQALRETLGRGGAKEWIRTLPRDLLTPRFIHDFNENYKRKTGKDIPYVVYQYKELFEQRLFLVPDASTLNQADMQHGRIIPLEQVRELKLPGA